MRDIIEAADAEIVCLQEAHEDFFGDRWFGEFSQPDTGYPLWPGRRKITLWSKHPWQDVDQVGSEKLPKGRFVSASTMTSLGEVLVVGICIPWAASHVSTGRRDRRRWDEHMDYLSALPDVLLSLPRNRPVIVVGDFNQSLPQTRAPLAAFQKLTEAMRGFSVWTTGSVAGLSRPSLCHIAGNAYLRADRVKGYSRDIGGMMVSDHDGLDADLALSQRQE